MVLAGPISIPSDASEAEPAAPTPGRPSLALLLALLAVGAVFVLHSTSWLAAPFGESHDGRNAAVWGMASRSIRDEGVVRSRFGGRSEPGYSYANHPPLIIAETTLAELVGGERRIVTRSPAWIGSLVALALMCRLLLDAGLSRLSVGVGIVAAFGSAMFFVYGSMLDTPVTALPFALLFLIMWQRAGQGKALHPAWLGAVSLLAVLAGWQSTTLVGVAAIGALWAAKRDRFAWRQWLAMAIGAAIGLCTTLLWIRWVYGSLGPLINNAQYRRSAIRILSEVEMGVPKPRVDYIPMGPTEAPGEEIEPDAKPVVEQETPEPARAPVSKKKKKRAHRRSE